MPKGTSKKVFKKHAFLKKVKDAIEQYDMLAKGDRVLVAVSGGADSVCLLKSLVEIKKDLGVEIIVANMDHSLRGESSKRDSKFVKDFSKELGLEFIFKKVDVKKIGNKKLSTEEKAREERYKFFISSAKKKKCNVICTGHTMDDQAETVLMRVIYGSSLSGLTGIPPVRYEGNIKISRPLIRIERSEVVDFIKNSKLKHVEDESNKDTKFARNSVRLKILPFIEKYNPRLKRSLANIADTLREDFVLLEESKKAPVSSLGKDSKVKIKDLILQPKAIRKEVFKELFKRAGGNVKKLTYRHWMDMDLFISSGQRNKSLNFPGKVKVQKKRDEIVFTRIS